MVEAVVAATTFMQGIRGLTVSLALDANPCTSTRTRMEGGMLATTMLGEKSLATPPLPGTR